MGGLQQYSGLARSLLETSQLTAKQLEQAVTQAAQEVKPLSRVLVELQLLSSEQLTQFCKQTYHLPVFDLSNTQPSALPPQYLSMDLIERHCALPLFLKNNILYLALSDPTNMAALDDFSFRFNLITDAQLVDEAQLALLLKQLQKGESSHLIDLEQVETDDLHHLTLTDENQQSSQGSQDDDAPIVRYIYKIMLEAVNCFASDIHFEPYERFYRIRFRIDGLLHDFASAPISYANRFAARLKVMAQLDISERRLPQDGRIKLQLPHHNTIDMRVSSLPIQAGEKIVLRLLDSSAIKLDINQLGFNEQQKQLYLAALNQSQGMILATGPTGSGKTVSLYTGLSILNTVSANISTAEDPVEIIMPGINQLQVNPKIGLSFAHALRAFLRQDPDIIMVGEIRDLETAEIAVKAAQTGHLVLSTLHTNSATETLTRLSNMGLAAYNIASSINIIIAQRLARKLCPHCKKPELLNAQQLTQLGIDVADTQTIYQANGCHLCTDGYKGRTGVYEVLPMNSELADLIIKGADSLTLARAAQAAGLLTLRHAALNKVQAGIISLAEANRITDK
ncbi:type IV-A pilus assembly ATPase PilB [Oceanisphaera pacifica]|uniref:Type IV-A pilus assembly ATPase PilB n=1 Tax=Oceanisphaera pacifica TaxID=2818389 RepID=A0ABS3NC95_9GAMM|nr:type IV-A pilus assembly ATPase PilB [Oceanisphaera pacifica]MBO1518150.1 type IV-A pilus assembly ATPase PilB [Oceanisphaera pacifica]